MSVALRRTGSQHQREHPLRDHQQPRRVRHQARDALAVAAVSAASSVGLAAIVAFLLAWLGRA